MFRSKTNLIVFIVIIAVAALIFSSVIAFMSIEDAKKENEAAQYKIAELESSVSALESSLAGTYKEVNDHEERIKKYQDIFTAWANATPKVSEAMDKIMVAYGRALENAHLFSEKDFEKLEDEMMNAVYTTLRSTDPLSVANDFEKTVEKANEKRFDVILSGKIDKIEAEGVTFPEDLAGITDARSYYNGFADNQAVMDSFAALGLDKELSRLEALLDADEENDLAAAFEKAVGNIKAPITLATSLKDANDGWNALCAALEETDTLAKSTSEARALLDKYTARVNQLSEAKTAADTINAKINALHVEPDVLTKDLIDKFERDISDWVKKYEIDEENMSMINDIIPLKEAYVTAVAELRALYEAFKKSVEDIGKIAPDSKAKLENAYKTYDAVKNYKDVNDVLNLTSPNTVGELFALLEKLSEDYDYLMRLIDSVRAEIDRLYSADPDVTRDEIGALNLKVDELASLGVNEDALNDGKTNYSARLSEVRLLPDKNDAFAQIKAEYDAYYVKANGNRDIIIELVEIKDLSLNGIESSNTLQEISSWVEKAKEEFEKCFE